MLHRLDFCEEEKCPEDSQPGLFRKMYNRLVEEIEFEAMNLEFEEEMKAECPENKNKSVFDNLMDKIQKLSEAFTLNKLPSFFEYVADVYSDLEKLPESQSMFMEMIKKMLVGTFGTMIFPTTNILSFIKEICNKCSTSKNDCSENDCSKNNDPISKNGFYPLYENLEAAKKNSSSGYVYYMDIDGKTYYMPSDNLKQPQYTIHRDHSHTITNCHNQTTTTISGSYNTR